MRGRVLMFHRILPRKKVGLRNAYWDLGTLITLEKFYGLLIDLIKYGYKFFKLTEFWSREQNNISTNYDIALTFDDGYIDNYEHAFPLLNRLGIKASFFPVWGPCSSGGCLPIDLYYRCLDNSSMCKKERMDYIRGAKKKQFMQSNKEEKSEMINRILSNIKGFNDSMNLYMTIDHIKEIISYGHEIGGHTISHIELPHSGNKEIITQLKINYNEIKSISKVQRIPFAYPDGSCDAMAIKYVKCINYYCACSINSGPNLCARWNIPREFVNQNYIFNRRG